VLALQEGPERFDLTSTPHGLVALVVFVVAYSLVVTEDIIKLRKSKPVIAAAGVLWILTSLAYHFAPEASQLPHDHMEQRVLHHLADFGALFLFLTVAMTYISAIAGHNVFLKINAWLVSAGFGMRAVFWTTGALAFVISPIADNLTTALLMGAVVITVGHGNPRFISLACINVVVAANAGGAFSPFGDITTLMVWQKGKVATGEFAALIVPSIVNWLIPALIMHFAVPKERPAPLEKEVELRDGWWVVTLLFLCTIATAVTFHAVLELPPFLGMTTGLAYLFFYGYMRRMRAKRLKKGDPLDVFKNVADVEWDTMLFFFGVIMCVGALSELGYLALASNWLYLDIGPFEANVGVGVISAVVDNIPVMFAVLNMDPEMSPTGNSAESLYQWLLVTLTAGVGGSLLSVGSAAGVALMGSAHGYYTFGRHLRWTPVIALGYAAAIWTHYLLNNPL
jgi:Na+/H+ antiporter NhaD/arsenite permease-like protein